MLQLAYDTALPVWRAFVASRLELLVFEAWIDVGFLFFNGGLFKNLLKMFLVGRDKFSRQSCCEPPLQVNQC